MDHSRSVDRDNGHRIWSLLVFPWIQPRTCATFASAEPDPVGSHSRIRFVRPPHKHPAHESHARRPDSTSDILIPQEIWDQELTASAPTKTDWLWQGFVAPANTTLCTSHVKLGKTTLVSMLLSRRKQGGTLAGLAPMVVR
jgi:hypothetical protein